MDTSWCFSLGHRFFRRYRNVTTAAASIGHPPGKADVVDLVGEGAPGVVGGLDAEPELECIPAGVSLEPRPRGGYFISLLDILPESGLDKTSHVAEILRDHDATHFVRLGGQDYIAVERVWIGGWFASPSSFGP